MRNVTMNSLKIEIAKISLVQQRDQLMNRKRSKFDPKKFFQPEQPQAEGSQ
jgi:hypothetical protein